MTESHYTKKVRDKIFSIKKRKKGWKAKSQTQRAPVPPPRPIRRRGLGDMSSESPEPEPEPEPHDHTAKKKRKADEECQPDQKRVKKARTQAPAKIITVVEKPNRGILRSLMSSALNQSANKRKLQDDDGPARKRPLTEEARQAFQRSVGFKGDPRPTRPFHNPFGDVLQNITKDECNDKATSDTAAATPRPAEATKSRVAENKKIKKATRAANTPPVDISLVKKGVVQPINRQKRKIDVEDELLGGKRQRTSDSCVQKELIRDYESEKQKQAAVLSSPPSIINRRNFCFMNASMHLLGNVPELAAISIEGDAIDLLDASPFDKEDFETAAGITRAAGKLRPRIHGYLQTCGDDLNKAFISKLVAMLKISMSGSDEAFDPTCFYTLCGSLLSTSTGACFDGQTQEDVGDFVQAVKDQMVISGESVLIEELFGIKFEQTMTCNRCGEEKSFKDDDELRLTIPKSAQQSGAAVNMHDLFQNFVNDRSKFEYYKCESCKKAKKIGRMVARERQGVKLLSKAPKYILAPITRAGQLKTGDGHINTKLDTNIVPTTKPIRLRDVTGGHIEYELEGFAEHEGDDFERGHYTAVRRMNGKWFHCDDAGRGVITELSVADIDFYKQATFCLFKKIDSSTSEEL